MRDNHLLDMASAGFLFAETRTTPMHIGTLGIFRLPEKADEPRFLRRLVDAVSDVSDFPSPFGDRIRISLTGPKWEKDDNIDIGYHVRRSGLPRPGGMEELITLTARLHGTPLDRERPLWEQHFIDGLEDRRFAIYTKIHHAAIDGMGLTKLSQSMFSTRKSERLKVSPFDAQSPDMRAESEARGKDRESPTLPDLRRGLSVLRERSGSAINISTVTLKYLMSYLRPSDLTVPWQHRGSTPLNTRLGAPRSLSVRSWELDRIRRLGKALGGTINDVVLASCSGALRSFLQKYHYLPEQPLTTVVPVSLRDKGETGALNQVAFVTVNLSTDTGDPGERFIKIQKSVRSGRELYRGLSATEAGVFSALSQAPVLAASLLGLTPKFPHSSVLISNVPGPSKTLYLDGAELEASYPVPALPQGIALNITVASYVDRMDCGVIACRRSLPQADKITPLLEESLRELEVIAGFG